VAENWLAKLASHFEATRERYPRDRLAILFNIDGTILDVRYAIQHVLLAYDRKHKTRYFSDLEISDISVHERDVGALVRSLVPNEVEEENVLGWFREKFWASSAVLETHRPFAGVLEVIRWFQLHPGVVVGLNTSRPESLRKETLLSLERLGREFKARFTSDLLYMNREGTPEGVIRQKIAGLEYFRAKGYRVFAVVDSEPAVLSAISRADPRREILLLHADTTFGSAGETLPPHVVTGRDYRLSELIPKDALPRHIQFVWHGINDVENLQNFLASDVQWGEVDVRLDPTCSELILRHDSFKKTPLAEGERWVTLEEALCEFRDAGKSVKLDLKAGGSVVTEALRLVDRCGFSDERLWFNGNVERVQREGFEKTRAAHPGAIQQCPVDFLAPLIHSTPDKAREILDMFTDWGINRFSLSWLRDDVRESFHRLTDWGFEVNIYNVPDLEGFLQAAVLLPRSITSDFNFPKWRYFGRGSGENGVHHEYRSLPAGA